MRLIIVRHGLTEENKAGIIQGHLPGRLAVEGIDQAQKLALRLKEEKIDYIYSSDLARASDTAQEIAKWHPQTPLIFTEEIRERNMGEFQGLKKYDFGIFVKSSTAQLEPKEGETINHLGERAKNFLRKIYTEHPNHNILLVGHNGINRAIMAEITGQAFNDVSGQHNTRVNIFELFPDGHHKIHVLNNISHLD